MNIKKSQLGKMILFVGLAVFLNNCTESQKPVADETKVEAKTVVKFPSDVLPSFDKWKILLGDGTRVDRR